MKGPQALLIAMGKGKSEGKSDKSSGKKQQRKLERISEELIEAVQTQDPKAVAMALQDAVECVQDGEDAYADDEEDDEEYD